MRVHILLITFAVLTGCATALTPQGAAIVMVDNQHDCSFIGSVTGSNAMGMGRAHDADGALNEMRNKASQMGANAVQVISITSNSNDTVAIGKALKCNF
jgi:uncharacterized protein YbjQ (UPF0145 family)